MNALSIVVGAASASLLVAALSLDAVVSARSSAPAPRHFSLFLVFYLILQASAVLRSAPAADPALVKFAASGPGLFVTFVLEDTQQVATAFLLLYLPRFLYASLGLRASRRARRVFMGILLMIGMVEVLAINVRAVAFWTDGGRTFPRMAVALENTVALPLYYGSFAYLIAVAARRRSQLGAEVWVPYFYGRGFLPILAAIPVADLVGRLVSPVPMAHDSPSGRAAAVPLLSLAGLVLGAYVVGRATTYLGSQAVRTPTPAEPEPDMRRLWVLRGLSPREVEVAHLLLRGLVNKEIATRLGIGYGTVKNHVYALFRKLRISSRFELVKLSRTGSGGQESDDQGPADGGA